MDSSQTVLSLCSTANKRRGHARLLLTILDSRETGIGLVLAAALNDGDATEFFVCLAHALLACC
jgi:hypothetical protein